MATITKDLIVRRLTIANCCAAKKGYNYLVNYEEKGKSNQAILDEIELLLALIDSIMIYTKEFDGEDVVDGDTCLTHAQINNILDKLCQICDAPCQTYVNFEEA